MGIEFFIISTIISIGIQVKAAQDKKKAAKRAAALQQAQLDIKTKQDELIRARQVAENNRLIRANRARILNQAAGQQVQFSSPVRGAITGQETRGRGNINFINQGAALAAQSDAVTGRQIELTKNTTIDNANSALLGGIFDTVTGGLSDLADAGIFSDGGSSTSGSDFASNPIFNPDGST